MSALRRSPLPPSRVLWIALAIATLATALCLTLASSQPYLGVKLAAEHPDAAPRVLAAKGPAAELLRRGDVLVALDGEAGRVALRGDDLAAEPDIAYADYASFAAFMGRQQRLATLQAGPQLRLLLADGRSVTLQPDAHRPLRDLPFTFWLQAFAAAACWMVGAAIWAFRREQPASVYLLITGFGTLLMAGSAAVYSTRELALPATLFGWLSQLNQGGALLCAGAFAAVLFHYPRSLGTPRWSALLVLGYVGLWLIEALHLLPFANRGVQGAILLSVLLAAALAIVQWRGARGDPLRRAALQWFLLSWFLGSSAYMLVVLIPALAGIDTGELQAYGFGLMWLVSLGLALGIARYRLFELETWWFRAVALVGGGAAVVIFDLLFVSLLDMSQPAALAMALAIAGWLYFPLRQWLATRVLQRFGLRRMRDVPALLREIIADSPLAAERLLPESLRRLFAPLQLVPLEEKALGKVRIVADGTVLRVPGIGRWPGWEVHWADHGNRLFNRQDARLAAAVRAVLERIVAYQDAVEASVERERTRVAADLHDDVGARLLTLLHRADGEQAQAIRETLASLRLIVHGLGAEPQPLAEALAEWRAELHERCEAAGVRVIWDEVQPLPDWRLDAAHQLHLARVLREAISNALRHAHPTLIEVRLSSEHGQLLLSITNDGSCRPPQQWRSGNGLRSMRSRTQKLGGELHIHGEAGRVVLRLRVPLDTSPPSGADPARSLA
ncbi:sensor histidine kinase [Solimonas flava]|uniref:sensor histidine kinase n=1 Tax=Solimonas flava TaxID=415849 RepID=UPI00040D9793|nr:ATP-binding protein [Solimonas flava]